MDRASGAKVPEYKRDGPPSYIASVAQLVRAQANGIQTYIT